MIEEVAPEKPPVSPEKHYCFNCRAQRTVRARPVGPFDFHQCIECGLWIRCPKCMHIRAVVDHQCPKKKEDKE
jgi:hypothetical protein